MEASEQNVEQSWTDFGKDVYLHKTSISSLEHIFFYIFYFFFFASTRKLKQFSNDYEYFSHTHDIQTKSSWVLTNISIHWLQLADRYEVIWCDFFARLCNRFSSLLWSVETLNVQWTFSPSQWCVLDFDLIETFIRFSNN